jgi:hypothetical protein
MRETAVESYPFAKCAKRMGHPAKNAMSGAQAPCKKGKGAPESEVRLGES